MAVADLATFLVRMPAVCITTGPRHLYNLPRVLAVWTQLSQPAHKPSCRTPMHRTLRTPQASPAPLPPPWPQSLTLQHELLQILRCPTPF